MASDNFLWKNLCKSTWRKVTAYKSRPQKSYKQLYLVLDEGSCLFNIDAERGINYLTAMGALDNDPSTIAAFLHNTNVLNSQQVFLYLAKRRDILSALIHLHDYGNMFLPEALRYFFWHIPAPRERGGLLEFMLNQFSHQFCICNPHCQLNHDTVYVICYSLILLAVDLASPHVKNKMSKREFIRNLRHAAYQGSDEYFGHLYDNIYLAGHVAPFNY
ncbi:F-box only protein 8-like isoform X2 [Corticium candelabrum]|nr:F-box only protein 8-like isoform X2 [Corticium candelabrum]